MVNYTRQLVRGTSLIFFATIISVALGYLLRILLARNLSVEEYGLFYATFAFISVLASFKGFGIGQALMKYIPEFKLRREFSKIKKGIFYYFSVQFVTYSILFLIMLFFLDKLSLFYFKDFKAQQLLILLGLTFLFAIFESLFHVLFLGYKKSNYYSFTNFFQMFLVVIITFVLLNLGFGYISPALGYLFASILSGIVYFFMFRKLSPEFFKSKSSFDVKFFKKLTLFGLPLTASAFIGSSVGQFDTLVLTYFTSLRDVALYHVALPVAMLLRQFSKSVSLIIIPISSEIYLSKKDLLIKGIKEIQKYILVIIIPVALVMAVFAPLIISLFFGEEYLEATLVLRILAVSAILYAVAHVNSNILLGVGRSGINAKIMVSGSLLALILNLILIPFLGIVGAGISVLISSFFMFFFSFFYLKKTINYGTPILLFLKLFILGGGFLIIINSLRIMPISNPWVEFIVIGVIGMLFYLVGLIFMNIISKEELICLKRRVI
jgi:O-antigen/teichoic acid export membrane protein